MVCLAVQVSLDAAPGRASLQLPTFRSVIGGVGKRRIGWRPLGRGSARAIDVDFAVAVDGYDAGADVYETSFSDHRQPFGLDHNRARTLEVNLGAGFQGVNLPDFFRV